MTSKRKDQIRELLKGIETGNEEAVAVTNRTVFQGNPNHQRSILK